MAQNRSIYTQYLDYRIFVISAYASTDLAPGVESAAASQTLLSEPPLTVGDYTFYKYAIDDFVKNVEIQRDIEGNPATLNISLFPILDTPAQTTKKNSKFSKSEIATSGGIPGGPYLNFYYPINKQINPIFQRMDYIEVQVAELTLKDDEINSKADKATGFRKLLSDRNRSASSGYSDVTTSSNYKVRFRGFITDIQEMDDADSGVSIKLKAKSVLHYLDNTPFITNLALIHKGSIQEGGSTDETRAYFPQDQHIVLMGDLLTNLKSAVDRVNSFLQFAFQVKTDSEKTQFNADLFQGSQLLAPYYTGTISRRASLELAALTQKLEPIDIKDAQGTQASLIPLFELLLAYRGNVIENNLIYRILYLQVFDQEVQFDGTNTDFISQYTYLLKVLHEYKDAIKYFLYEEADGSIVFERPILNGAIDTIIDNTKYLSYTMSQTESGFFTEVFSLPGSPLQYYGTAEERSAWVETSGFTLDQLRRFGYRRPDAEFNPNVNNPKALQFYSQTMKALNNSQLKILTLTIPYDKSIDLGFHIWFQERNLVGYVTGISENITYGEKSSMTVTMTFLREVSKIKVPLKDINISNVNNLIQNGVIVIDNIPEFTFVSDFYNGDFQSTETASSIPRPSPEFNTIIPPPVP